MTRISKEVKELSRETAKYIAAGDAEFWKRLSMCRVGGWVYDFDAPLTKSGRTSRRYVKAETRGDVLAREWREWAIKDGRLCKGEESPWYAKPCRNSLDAGKE